MQAKKGWQRGKERSDDTVIVNDVVCLFYLKGNCARGKKCGFPHTSPQEEERQRRLRREEFKKEGKGLWARFKVNALASGDRDRPLTGNVSSLTFLTFFRFCNGCPAFGNYLLHLLIFELYRLTFASGAGKFRVGELGTRFNVVGESLPNHLEEDLCQGNGKAHRGKQPLPQRI